ncbi:MAG: TonB-dependent siderophore receptor [Methylocystis sp.]
MTHARFTRGVSVCTLAFLCSSAIAQQSLPTIDVGGQNQHRRSGSGAKPLAGGGANVGGAEPTAENSQVAGGGRSTNSAEPTTPTEGYVVRDASTAMKADIPIMETPASIVVIPKQVLRDQAINRVQDAVDNVSGVRSVNDDLQGFVYKIRGFTTFDVFRNQLVQGGESNFNGDTANVERIEILKGPASVLYGRTEPGGIINIVTKQPLFEPRYVVQQQIGNYDHYRTQWDFTAPVKESPGLAWRLSGAYTASRFFRDSSSANRILVAPVVTYQPTAWTEFTGDAQYYGNVSRVMTGLPSIGPNPINVPVTHSYQGFDDPRDHSKNFLTSYMFRQNLSEDWKIVNRFLYSSNWLTQNLLKPNGLSEDLSVMDRVVQQQSIKGRTFSTNINLEGKFQTFGAKHLFLFGLDYLNKYYDYYLSEGSLQFPINLYGPYPGYVPPFAFDEGLAGGGFKYLSSTLWRQKGMYVQDHVTFLDDRVHVLLGVRYDVADQNSGDSCCGFDSTKGAAILARLRNRTFTDTGWSPRYGIVFDVTPEVSVYGSFTRSFGPSNLNATQALPPQRGTQWEVGLKALPLPGVTATLAFYQLTRSNLVIPNFATPDPGDVALAGLQRSRGIELDVMGAVTDRLAIIANYAYIDAKVISDNAVNPFNRRGDLDPAVFGEVGGLYLNHLDNVPRHSGKLWLTYDFGDDGLGFRAGGGVTASSTAWGDIQNTVVLPAWARLDAFASYTTAIAGHRVSAQLNLNNITNARYFSGTDIFFSVRPWFSAFAAPPFTAWGTLKFEW